MLKGGHLPGDEVVDLRAGRRIGGAQLVIAKSKWEEDVFINNHTSVWGSYWRDSMWGYACCRSHMKNSYCTGMAGARAAEESADLMQRNIEKKIAQAAVLELQLDKLRSENAEAVKRERDMAMNLAAVRSPNTIVWYLCIII